MFQLSVCLFLVAVVSAFLRNSRARMLGNASAQQRTPPGTLVRVCFTSCSEEEWQAVVLHYMERARSPAGVRFGILLQCDSTQNVRPHDRMFRNIVALHHVPRVNMTALRRMRRLARRFVTGDETRVVLVDPRVRVRWGWDDNLLQCPLPENVLLTSPAHADAGFPTLLPVRHGETPAVARGPARPLASQDSPHEHVPAVCLCHEFVAGTPGAFANGAACTPAVLTTPLLESDSCLETRLLAEYDDAREEGTCTPLARIGLSEQPTAFECVCKYGSTSAAKLALRFQRTA